MTQLIHFVDGLSHQPMACMTDGTACMAALRDVMNAVRNRVNRISALHRITASDSHRARPVSRLSPCTETAAKKRFASTEPSESLAALPTPRVLNLSAEHRALARLGEPLWPHGTLVIVHGEAGTQPYPCPNPLLGIVTLHPPPLAELPPRQQILVFCNGLGGEIGPPVQ